MTSGKERAQVMTVKKNNVNGRRNGHQLRDPLAGLTPAQLQEVQEVYQSLDKAGRELFALSLMTPDDPQELMTPEEISRELARRRGGLAS
jgi:hypothetical protein